MYKAVLAAPDDLTARLVWADWLDEGGGPGAAEVSALLRFQACQADGDAATLAMAAMPHLLDRYTPKPGGKRRRGRDRPWSWRQDEVQDMARGATWTLYDGLDRPRMDVVPVLGLPTKVFVTSRDLNLALGLVTDYPVRYLRPTDAAPVNVQYLMTVGYSVESCREAVGRSRDRLSWFVEHVPRAYQWRGWLPVMPLDVDDPDGLSMGNGDLSRCGLGILPVAVHDRLQPSRAPGRPHPWFYPTAEEAADALAAAVARWAADGRPIENPRPWTWTEEG